MEERIIIFSREELESLRFVVSAEAQKRLWDSVYHKLGPAVSQEYDNLLLVPTIKSGSSFRPTRRKKDPEAYRHITGDVVDEDYWSGLLRPAFAIHGEPDFESGPPEDGMEYLRRVRWEADRIPSVVVAGPDSGEPEKQQTDYMPKIPLILPCPPPLKPVKAWEEAFLRDFSRLRASVPPLPSDPESPLPSDSDEDDCGNRLVACSPAGDEGTIGREVLNMDGVARIVALKKHVSMAESSQHLSRDRFLWLFSLCAAVDTPLDADSSAAMRALLRKCCALRALETPIVDEYLVMLNIIITITGRYFGQLEPQP